MAHISHSEASIVCCSSWVSFVLFLGVGSVGVGLLLRRVTGLKWRVLFLFLLRYQRNYRCCSLYSRWNPPFPWILGADIFIIWCYIVFSCVCHVYLFKVHMSWMSNYIIYYICILQVLYIPRFFLSLPPNLYTVLLQWKDIYLLITLYGSAIFYPLRMRAHLRHIPDICPLEVCPIAFFQHRSA